MLSIISSVGFSVKLSTLPDRPKITDYVKTRPIEINHAQILYPTAPEIRAACLPCHCMWMPLLQFYGLATVLQSTVNMTASYLHPCCYL